MIKYIKKAIHITGITKLENGEYKLEHEIVRILETQSNEIDLDDLHTEINNKKYIPKKKDKLFFLPGCTVPRFKLKDYCAKHGIAPVKYITKADVVFVGPESYKELFDKGAWRYTAQVHFKEWIDNSFPIGDPRILQLKYDLETQNEFQYILFETSTYFQLTRDGQKFPIRLKIEKDERGIEKTGYKYCNTVKDDKCWQVLQDIASGISKYYSQDDLLKDLNTGTVMDLEMYEQLCKMINSTDKENLKLAMELMANCDFEKSCVYLLLLIKKYGFKFYTSESKNHVNFKSLIKFFNIKNISNISLDIVINSLKNKNFLTTDNLNLLMPLAMNEIKEKADTECFVVTQIDIKPDIKVAVQVSDIISTGAVIIESDKSEAPLMSSKMVIMDMSEKID